PGSQNHRIINQLPSHTHHPHLVGSGGQVGQGLSLPFLLGHDQPGQVRVQLVLLVDPFLLDAVPAFLLGDAQRAGDVIPKIQPLLLGEVGDGLVVVLHLHLALPQEEVSFDRLPIQLQRPLTVGQCLVVLLHLQVAQRPVGVIHGHQRVPVLRGNHTGSGLGVLAAAEQPVAQLLVLLRAMALLGAASPRSRSRCARSRGSSSLPFPFPFLLPLHGPARPGRSGPAAPLPPAAQCDSAATPLHFRGGASRGAGHQSNVGVVAKWAWSACGRGLWACGRGLLWFPAGAPPHSRPVFRPNNPWPGSLFLA
uniref:Uncharacterized protein n=1 Tax=Coturnix japonica TaxID=93934 RepID=A0A8C2TZF2_COTJA